MAKNTEYNASSIKALSQHDHLLKRISLTFGAETGDKENPYSSQKTIAFREIADNSVDEVLAGHGQNVRVHFYEDQSVEIQDAGRGLPVDVGVDSEGKKVNGVYLTLGVIQSGGKFETDGSRFSSGLNGVGASSTIHLSKRADVSVFRNGWEYYLSFKDGVPGYFKKENDPESDFTELSDYKILKKKKDTRPASEKKKFPTGTKIRTWLRDEVFSSSYPINRADLIERLKGTAYLVPDLTVEVEDELNTFINPDTNEEDHFKETYHFEEGMKDLITQDNKELVSKIMQFDTEGSFVEKDAPVLQNGKVVHKDIEKRVPVEVAMAWNKGYDYNIDSFVNTIKTRLGGVHEKAFEKTLEKVFNEKLQSMRGMIPKGLVPTIDDYKEGLSVVLSIKVSEPEFTSQTKEELGGRTLHNAITKVLTKEFTKFVNAPKNAQTMKEIGKKVVSAAKARQASLNAKLAKRKTSQLSSAAMPSKLSDCSITGEEESELFIVEGDSAKGPALKARDATYQAILPLRGKLINGLKSNLSEVLKNKEVNDLIKAFGTGIGKEFEIDDARYKKAIILTDADDDGAHIALLVFTVFNKLFKKMIEEGRVYQAFPPLYEVTTKSGKNETDYYVRTEQDLTILTEKLNSKKIKYEISRNKGLGSTTAKALNETVFNPETRILKRITVDDLEKASEMLTLTMGEDKGAADARKEFMSENYQVAINSGLIKGFENNNVIEGENFILTEIITVDEENVSEANNE